MEFNEDNFKALQTEAATLRDKLKGANDEAKGHRLSAESFRSQADEFRTKFTESASAIEDLKKLHGTELESVKLDFGAKLTAAEAKAAEAASNAAKKIMMADLKMAAREAGMLDLEFLKLLDLSTVKQDDEGGVTNAAELMAAMKEAKPYMFDPGKKPGVLTGTTTSTSRPPASNQTKTTFDARTASGDEVKRALAELTRIR